MNTGICRESFDWYTVGRVDIRKGVLTLSKNAFLYREETGETYRIRRTENEKGKYVPVPVKLKILPSIPDETTLLEEYETAVQSGHNGVAVLTGSCQCSYDSKGKIAEGVATFPVTDKALFLVDSGVMKVTEQTPVLDYCYTHSAELALRYDFPTFDELDDMDVKTDDRTALSVVLYNLLRELLD